MAVIVRRSRILYNTGTEHAAAIYFGALYDCVIDGHASLNACTHTTTPIVNCTFGPDNGLRAITKISGICVTNTLFMSEFQPGFVTSGDVKVDHCLFATNTVKGTVVTASADSLVGTNSRLVDYRDVRLKRDYTVRSRSAAIDAGDSSVAGERDVYGAPRICGSAVDVGAAEYDPSKAKGLLLLVR